MIISKMRLERMTISSLSLRMIEKVKLEIAPHSDRRRNFFVFHTINTVYRAPLAFIMPAMIF